MRVSFPGFHRKRNLIYSTDTYLRYDILSPLVFLLLILCQNVALNKLWICLDYCPWNTPKVKRTHGDFCGTNQGSCCKYLNMTGATDHVWDPWIIQNFPIQSMLLKNKHCKTCCARYLGCHDTRTLNFDTRYLYWYHGKTKRKRKVPRHTKYVYFFTFLLTTCTHC